MDVLARALRLEPDPLLYSLITIDASKESAYYTDLFNVEVLIKGLEPEKICPENPPPPITREILIKL